MKRLWLRWIGLLVFVVVVGSLFIRLGEWQLHRLAWRRGNNAIVERNQVVPVRPYTDLMGSGRTITTGEQWQRVTLTGTYDASHQMQAIMRNTLDASAQAGNEVLTPMHTTRGDWVLVDRGFILQPNGATALPNLPDPPKGTVTVVGYLRSDEPGKSGAIQPLNGSVRLVNPPALDATLPYTLVDGFVGLTSSSPAQSGGMLPMSTPEITEGPHLSYAIQWFCFTVIGVVGAGLLVRTDLRDRKKREQKRRNRQQRLAAAAAGTTGTDTSSLAAAAAPAGAHAAPATPPTSQED